MLLSISRFQTRPHCGDSSRIPDLGTWICRVEDCSRLLNSSPGPGDKSLSNVDTLAALLQYLSIQWEPTASPVIHRGDGVKTVRMESTQTTITVVHLHTVLSLVIIISASVSDTHPVHLAIGSLHQTDPLPQPPQTRE